MENMENTTLQTPKAEKKPGKLRGFFKVLGRIALVLLETVLLVVIALYGVMYVVAKGPSPTARDLFVMSVRETSAVGFLANLYFTDEQIAAIENKGQVEEYVETDTSLIVMPTVPEEKDPQEGPQPDAWGLVDEDGDGIIVEPVKGEGYSGYMMVVLDPSRVIMGCRPGSFGGRGYTVEQMVHKFGAVAGINAGGFEDLNGAGNGETPDSLVVFEGQVYYASSGLRDGFVGIDSNNILHVGKLSVAEIQKRDIQYGAGSYRDGFGRVDHTATAHRQDPVEPFRTNNLDSLVDKLTIRIGRHAAQTHHTAASLFQLLFLFFLLSFISMTFSSLSSHRERMESRTSGTLCSTALRNLFSISLLFMSFLPLSS